MFLICEKIRQDLRGKSDPRVRISSQRFFKEKNKFYGVKTLTVRQIGKKYWKKIQDSDKKEIFDMCEELWKSGYMEESFIACNWSYYLCKKYEPKDFSIFEKWVNNYISNWASCDTFCNHTVGAFLEMYPKYLEKIKKWTKSKNRWTKRASAVSLIIPAKRGKFLPDVFKISNVLLLDKDDLVQKGYGWLLKVASNKHQKEVFEYVMENKTKMPRTALRYAIEKMPKNLKTKAMAK